MNDSDRYNENETYDNEEHNEEHNENEIYENEENNKLNVKKVKNRASDSTIFIIIMFTLFLVVAIFAGILFYFGSKPRHTSLKFIKRTIFRPDEVYPTLTPSNPSINVDYFK